jgi:hypothetical protein
MELDFSEYEIEKALCELNFEDFYKTMESECKQGVMLDVYKFSYLGCKIYTHFYIERGKLIINSFHER